MNFKEAYNELNIPEGSSKDEAKKAFKKLAAKYHPDVNKDADAEDKFKKINEAWQIIESGKPTTREEGFYGNGGGFNTVDLSDFINSTIFRQNSTKKRRAQSDIMLHETISFKESVLGCTRDITYNRSAQCDICNGNGRKEIDNGCKTCGGKGMITKRHGFTIMQQTCPSCKGNVNFEECSKCSGMGSVDINTTATVNIPAGVHNDNILNLGSRGHYVGNMMGIEQSTRLLMKITVIPQKGLTLEDNDVISETTISLLEALQGCVKTMPTIDGDQDIIIPEFTKHSDKVMLQNLGVARRGSQVVKVNVEYPKDISNLISYLKKE